MGIGFVDEEDCGSHGTAEGENVRRVDFKSCVRVCEIYWENPCCCSGYQGYSEEEER